MNKDELLNKCRPLIIKDDYGIQTQFVERSEVLKAMDIWAKHCSELAFDAGAARIDWEENMTHNTARTAHPPNKEQYLSINFPE
jgi:metal-dependent HD superfamily phosphatase/phosphodiesterase